MPSKKPSARRKQRKALEAESFDLSSMFEREERQQNALASRREEALREKACLSKQRYSSKTKALDAIRACEEHGHRGLRCYRCEYCDGWHLTHKAVK